MTAKKKNINYGAAILFIIFGLLFFVLAGRFVYIQVTGEAEGQLLAVKAQEKTLKERTLEANRGNIVDRNGSVLAEDTSAYKLIAVLDDSYVDSKGNPKYVTDPEETAAALAEHIDMEESAILERLQKKDVFQVEFGKAGRDISHSVKQSIEKLDLPGISFIRDTKRFYPHGVFASHVIGYVEAGEDNSTTVGKLGLEKTLDKYLQGKDGSVNYETDLWGYLLPNSEENIEAPQNGKNVKLTLDSKIQTFVENSLANVQKEYNPKKLIAIVMDPKTGEVLAMGQRPSFNPSTKEGLGDTWMNLSVEENYELGSTMKVFALAAAVEEGVFNPNATYESKKLTYSGSSIKDHSGITPGKTYTYLQGVQRSSNVAFVKIVLEQLGAETYMDYLKAFDFDKKTGIDLPNEVGSTFVYEREIEQATTAYGQGSVFTPVQIMKAFTAIANDGKMMKPYIIDSISDQNGKILKKTEQEVAGEPISKETAQTVRGYLETVVSDEKGTGVKYAIDGYTVAGKTGTAQIVGSGGGYESGWSAYYYSFIGMAPADDPELIMYVAMQEPTLPAGKSAADGLSSVFKPVMKNSLNYLNIKPSDATSKETYSIEDFEDADAGETKEKLGKLGYEVIVLGNGKAVSSQSPAAGTKLLQGEKVVLYTGGETVMPDLTGWSMRDVMKVTDLIGLELGTSGMGYAAKQQIKPGTPVKKGDYCLVEFRTPDSEPVEEEEIEPEGGVAE